MPAGVTRRATVSFELDELRLIAAAKAGDKPAYEQLLRRHQVAVFHAAYLRIGSAAQSRAPARSSLRAPAPIFRPRRTCRMRSSPRSMTVPAAVATRSPALPP